MSNNLLVIDDDEMVCEVVSSALTMPGYRVRTAYSGEQGLACCQQEMPSLVLLDIRLPGIDGLETLRRIKEMNRSCRVVIITGYETARTAVEAMKLGAEDYITKPMPLEELRALVTKLVGPAVPEKVARGKGLDKLVGESVALREVFDIIRRISRTSATVLITGESGTGKELVAHAIHLNSGRADRPFLSINCASIPGNLLEAELFGYERGAFTDAKVQKRGLIEVAGSGSLLLDEIGLMPLDLQAKILTVLETRQFRRVGGTELISTGVRFMASTNRDLEKAVKTGEFREDLYYRLNVIPIRLPSLRERSEDILLLARHFLDESCRRYNVPLRELSAEAQSLLMAYPWAGNVRELKNAIERAVLLTDGPAIRARDLSINRREEGHETAQSPPVDVSEVGLIRITFPPWGLSVEDLERQLIEEALKHTGGNISRAARLLHLSRYAMRYRMEKHRIDFPRQRHDDVQP